MVELLLTISNLGLHTHFIKRRHTLKICESKAFFCQIPQHQLTINGNCPRKK
jgi:hypothetical protein